MKILTMLTGACIFFASVANANIGDIDAEIEGIKENAIFVAQPGHVTDRHQAAADGCILPIDYFVAVPEGFDAAGEFVVACAAE